MVVTVSYDLRGKVVGMSARAIAGSVFVARPLTGLREALVVDEDRTRGSPDRIALLFFATAGLLGVAAVVGMVFVGMAATVHGMAQLARSVSGGRRRPSRDGLR